MPLLPRHDLPGPHRHHLLLQQVPHADPRYGPRLRRPWHHLSPEARWIDRFFFFFVSSRIAAGKNPRPTDETEYALAQLEILSADTASVFSDDVEPANPRSGWGVDDDDDARRPPLGSRSTTGRSFVPNSRQGTGAASSSPYRESGSVREGQRSRAMNSGLNRDSQTEAERSASPLRSRVTDLRPSSRRTRRLSSGDVDARSGAGSGTDSESDVPAPDTSYRRRASPLSSQELEVASVLSGLEPINIDKSPE